ADLFRLLDFAGERIPLLAELAEEGNAALKRGAGTERAFWAACARTTPHQRAQHRPWQRRPSQTPRRFSGRAASACATSYRRALSVIRILRRTKYGNMRSHVDR